MYKELEKYKTGDKIKTIGVLPDGQETKIFLDEYAVNLGDLINDFVEHKNKSWWKRKYYHNHLTELYIKMMNKIEIRHGF